MLTVLATILAAALAGLVLQAIRLARRWRKGRIAAVPWKRGLALLPYTYLVTVHGIVARDRNAARMHALAAGGAILVGATAAGYAATGATKAAVAMFAAAIVALLGVAMAVSRRFPQRLPRLSAGPFNRFAPSLGAFASGAVLLAASDWAPFPTAWVGLLLMAGGAAVLVNAAAGGPLRHAVAGTVWLVAHARPKRLAGQADTALRQLELGDERLGVQVTADLGWNRLASFDACVQCGRCEAACPAFAAGQPLNPKALVADIVQAMAPAVTEPYAGHEHPALARPTKAGRGVLLGVDGTVSPQSLWACTTCRACVAECPMLIEHVDTVVDMRRHLILEAGDAPQKVSEALHALRATDTLSGRDPASRLDWATDLALPRIRPDRRVDVLLWLGDGAFQRRNQRTLRALVTLMRRADIDFAVLGPDERDCGDTARRLGDEATFQALARENIATLAGLRFDRIVSPDPHAVHALAREYPEFGGRYTVTHHSTLLAELLEAGRLRPAAAAATQAVTYHDPCYLGRYLGELNAPRRVLSSLGLTLVEMERSGVRSQCCGGGGGAALADVPGARRIPDVRMDQIRSTRASVVAVACPTCALMLEGVTGPRPEVADLAELTLMALEGAE